MSSTTFKRPRRQPRDRPPRVLLILEHVSLARDHRVRKQIGSLLSAGYRVALVCRRDDDNKNYRRPGLDIYEYPAPPERGSRLFFVFEYGYSLLAALVLMIRAAAHGAFDVIQTGHPPDIYFVTALPAKPFGTRFVVDQRDLSPEIYAERFGQSNGPIPRALRILERASWRSADHVITVNESLVRAIMERGDLPRDRVTAVGNGPSLAVVDGRAGDGVSHEGFSRLVCWVGVMGPQDHVDLALDAISHYVHRLKRDDALFAFIGDGEEAPGLRQLAADLKIEEFVRFTGWLDEAEFYAYLAAADLGLDTNLQPEVTPVKCLEYMAHALPFVAFDLEETGLLAADAARYVDAGDVEQMAREIAWLLDRPEERRRLGRVARDRIEREFAWECQEQRYLRVFAQLLGAGGSNELDREPGRAR